jgi:hypothetical protein
MYDYSRLEICKLKIELLLKEYGFQLIAENPRDNIYITNDDVF